VLEGLAHNSIPTGPELKFRVLTITIPKKPSFSKIKLPAISVIQFRDLSSLPSILPNVYYYPESKIFPTIDAFCIVDGHFLNPKKYKKGQFILVLFQVTVSNKHKVDGPTVKRIHQKFIKRYLKNGKEVEK
jgi:RHS (Retrotransposon Hot Spot) family protein